MCQIPFLFPGRGEMTNPVRLVQDSHKPTASTNELVSGYAFHFKITRWRRYVISGDVEQWRFITNCVQNETGQFIRKMAWQIVFVVWITAGFASNNGYAATRLRPT